MGWVKKKNSRSFNHWKHWSKENKNFRDLLKERVEALKVGDDREY